MTNKKKNSLNGFNINNSNVSITINSSNNLKKEAKQKSKISQKESEDLKFLFKLYSQKEYDLLLNNCKNFVKKYPNNTDGLNALALAYKNKNQFKKAIEVFEKIISLNPNIDYIYQNIANILYDQGDAPKALENYKKTLSLNPNSFNAMNGIGLVLSNSGDNESAVKYFLDALKLNPDNKDINYNTASSYRKLEKYNEAISHYIKSPTLKSKSFQLECMYLSGNENIEKFYALLNELGSAETLYPIAASISAHASIEYSNPDPYPFCNEPFSFIYKFNLFDHKDFDENLINQFLSDVNQSSLSQRGQPLLKNGYQTSGNLFLLEYASVKKIVKIIEEKIEDYRAKFKESDAGIIKNWPKKYNLFGWLIKIKKGGSLSSHMHNEGWLSSSIYLKRPKKTNSNDGDIEFSLDGGNFPKIKRLSSEKKIIDIKKGDMVSFPSSLFHSTIPFSSDDDRITLAFDIIPIN
ncbi:tetratricopeptide repeat protein [Hyphomicrobiales bacterium]|nr:tetratricopeptide repeat protein [Hyphomicrobiales bacterium]